MAWFDKALKSVQSTAEKAAFEADKLVRVKREESALADIQRAMQTRLADLGQAALALYHAGSLADPSVAALAQEIAGLEEQVQQQKEKLEAVRGEQYQPGGQPAAPAPAAEETAPAAPAAEEPARVAPAPAAEEPAPAEPEAPASVTCPNCQTEVKATVTFCPECGTRLK